jgi:ATP-dependent RNA helicase DHX29
MAGAKKKSKKPAANPARGFATTSIASKPVARLEPTETPAQPKTPVTAAEQAPGVGVNEKTPSSSSTPGVGNVASKTELTAEEFGAQLEESELQLLVEKHAAKVKRDSQRQVTRLDKDRRLLRGQADPLNCAKWLPAELIDHVLNLIHAESRYSTSSVSSETPSTGAGKMPPEEDLIMKLWTLRQVLTGVGLPSERVQAIVEHVLKISPSISNSIGKESIWGLEEAFEHMAKECPPDELPSYDMKPRQSLKPTGMFTALTFPPFYGGPNLTCSF